MPRDLGLTSHFSAPIRNLKTWLWRTQKYPYGDFIPSDSVLVQCPCTPDSTALQLSRAWPKLHHGIEAAVLHDTAWQDFLFG